MGPSPARSFGAVPYAHAAPITHEDLGYSDARERIRTGSDLERCEIGRVTTEHKERYVVRTAEGE